MTGKVAPPPASPALSPSEDPKSGYLVLKLKTGEGITINHEIEILLRGTSRGKAHIAVRAPKSIPIKRKTEA
jgi:hypothetical protein